MSTAAPVRCPRWSTGAVTTLTSIACAADRIEEWALSAQTIFQPSVGRGRDAAAAARAVMRAERLPRVPPLTKHPAAVPGHPSSWVSQVNASFSAWMAPAPASQVPAKMFAAPVTASKASAALVGAAGMYARFVDPFWARVAGARTWSNSLRAAAPPIPQGVMAVPAARARSAAGRAAATRSGARMMRRRA